MPSQISTGVIRVRIMLQKNRASKNSTAAPIRLNTLQNSTEIQPLMTPPLVRARPDFQSWGTALKPRPYSPAAASTWMSPPMRKGTSRALMSRRRTGLPRWNIRIPLLTSSMGGANQKP